MNVSSRIIHILSVVLLLAAGGLAVYFFVGTKPSGSSASGDGSQISPSISERETDASRSWQILVSTTRRECAKDKSGAALDFESLQKYRSGAYGVMVLAWPQSEYVIELYGYDPFKKVWVAGPRRETDFGDEIDIVKTSETWAVPKEVLSGWIDEAAGYMKRKYGNGEN